MKRPLFFVSALIAVLALITMSGAWAQQEPKSEPLTTEQRLERLEHSLAAGVLQSSPSQSPSGLEARLDRLEARVQRLEQQALRSNSATGGDRFLEGRVRALEREVSRLRR